MSSIDLSPARSLPIITIWSLIGWGVFGKFVVLATAPVWRLAVMGMNPTLDGVLTFLCETR